MIITNDSISILLSEDLAVLVKLLSLPADTKSMRCCLSLESRARETKISSVGTLTPRRA